jgi:mannose-6-phosphate isomerase-like protein (cupin superfamily)
MLVSSSYRTAGNKCNRFRSRAHVLNDDPRQLLNACSGPSRRLPATDKLPDQEMPVGVSSEEHFHEEREESYIVLSGTGQARIDGV